MCTLVAKPAEKEGFSNSAQVQRLEEVKDYLALMFEQNRFGETGAALPDRNKLFRSGEPCILCRAGMAVRKLSSTT
jgi:hypothetical protein